MALLIAVVSIALLTAAAADFAYESRVDLQLAANQRDALRAHYLAKSAVGLSRLVLQFQKQLDQNPMPGLSGLMGALGGQAPAGGAAGGLNLQIWRMVRVDCEMLRGMSRDSDRDRDRDRDEDRERSGADPQERPRAFGGFDGCFSATLSDEEERINLNKLDAPDLTSRAVVERLLELFGDKRFEFLFEREDQNRVRVTPQDVLINLRDWIDEDEVQASLNLTGQGTQTFLPGFSDENFNYDRYDPRYRAKNARFDSLDELYLVHGVNDAFMAAFRDRFTVYPDINRNLNVNTDDALLLYVAVMSVMDPRQPDARMANPLFVDQLIREIRAARMFSFMGTSVQDFLAVVEAAGIPINPAIRSNVQGNRFVSDKSETFRISAVGQAGSVQRRITAVVRTDQGLGKLVYWREE